MKLLNNLTLVFTTLSLLLFSTALFSQEPPEEKTPQEYAAIETDRLIEELELNSAQAFYADSTLQSDYGGLKEEFDKMKKSGMQVAESYQTVRKKWTDKTMASFKKVFTEQQYIKYLKLIGDPEGKKYKKGKDGFYYTKEELKKKKKK